MILRKVVVGLGNPGIQYHNTPHNLGFKVVDCIAAESGAVWETKECSALTVQTCIADYGILLAKPQTYMNLSGKSVAQLLEKFALSARDLIVAADDLALPMGKIRLRGQGSSAGHKGLQSIIERLNTDEFVRVRMGIAPGYEVPDVASYVLSPIPAEFKELAAQMIKLAKEAVRTVCSLGLEAALNQFN